MFVTFWAHFSLFGRFHGFPWEYEQDNCRASVNNNVTSNQMKLTQLDAVVKDTKYQSSCQEIHKIKMKQNR